MKKSRAKKLIAAMLSAVLLLSAIPAASAASEDAEAAVQNLYELGLFQGTGTDANGNPNFDLDRTPNRNEAVTMLVRLLGEEDAAKAGNWTTPFTDVADWVKPYVGYAYANELTNGTSNTTYSGDALVTVSQYLTFVLRALGYESGTDFAWDKAWELSDRIGLTHGQYNADTKTFTRGDVAIISNQALSVKGKGETVTLYDKLKAAGVFDPKPEPETPKTVVYEEYAFCYKTLEMQDGKLTAEVVMPATKITLDGKPFTTEGFRFTYPVADDCEFRYVYTWDGTYDDMPFEDSENICLKFFQEMEYETFMAQTVPYPGPDGSVSADGYSLRIRVTVENGVVTSVYVLELPYPV